MTQRRRSFLIRDILADVSVDDFSDSSIEDQPTTTAAAFPSGFPDLGMAVVYTLSHTE